MKIGRLFLAAILACSLGGVVVGDEKKPDTDKKYKEGGCCDKAKKAGKECDHKCCVAAEKEGKVCEKCNGKAEKK
jgi:hypothetical protein